MTETQAINTLLRGFELGVNLVHTAPDYEGAEDLVAKAIARTSHRVIVASQGYDVHYNSDGPVKHFEHLFESTCRRFRTDRLDLFGIACVDDREAYRENVWGKGGMVEFLRKKKDQGRLGGIFCTTHGNPEYIAKLVRSGAFDAVMVAYNELGFHLLSYSPPAGRHFESLPRNKLEVFPLCKELDVGVMVMKPLAGGLLCRGQAFPARYEDDRPRARASDVLRSILENPEVACVVPGTASVEEAEENARAGHAPLEIAPPVREQLRERISLLQTDLCSRCGICDKQCSQKMSVSWMFRAAYVALHPSETFETWNEVEYFRLHPKEDLSCTTCPDITCACPYGIDIPRSLDGLHAKMTDLRDAGLVAPAPDAGTAPLGGSEFGARVVSSEIPNTLAPRERAVARLFVENTGSRSWLMPGNRQRSGVALAVSVGSERPFHVYPRDDVHPRGRCHFVFEVEAPAIPGRLPVRLQLLDNHRRFSAKTGPVLFEGAVEVLGGETQHPVSDTNPTAFAVEWVEHNLPDDWPVGSPFHAYVRVANRGSQTWRPRRPGQQGVKLLVRVDGGQSRRVALARPVAPGQEVTLGFPLSLSNGPGPTWEVKLSLEVDKAGWFSRWFRRGPEPLTVLVRKGPAENGPTAEALAIACRSNSWGYQPTQGLRRGRDGRPYPLFIREARGCRIRELEGNEWVDYVMGWGSALLGYAHPELQAAVASQLSSGAVLSLPSGLEMDLTAALCSRFPGAEAVLFGKNGSDVCTAAVRIARLHTGKRKVLFSGYHGWQDWYAEAASPELAAPAAPPTAFRFKLNDFGDFSRLVKEHRGEIAAVVLEPAAQVEGVDGPVRPADPEFLANVARVCQKQGIVLVFDEIMTGFRHPGGSVQQATGVVPDLTCLGKGLSSGWPLSALIGRRAILESTMSRIFYHPTFKGEAHSMAAALAALQVYSREDVPGYVHSFGTQLMVGVTEVCERLGVAGRMVGQPYRMVFEYLEPDVARRSLKRTLLIQELMKRQVLTFRGFMLPSLAHGEAELAHTLAAFDGALRVVREAEADGSFARRLEVPLVI